MRLVIFGGTGSLGRELVTQAVNQGHEVTVLVRSPDKLPPLLVSRLRIYKGDILHLPDVVKTVEGKDAVLCAIGDGGKGMVRAAGTQNIIEAMKFTGVRRLICQTTLGMGDSRGNLNFFWRHVMFGIILRKAYIDHERQEELLLKCGLDYTIVRPSAFTDGPLSRKYEIGFNGSRNGLKLKISRADIADFMLSQLTSDDYQQKAVSIST